MQQYPTTPDPQQAPQPAPNPQQMSPQNPPPFAPPFAPAPGTPNPPNPPQSNRRKLLIGGGIGCGVLLVLCMCVGLLSAIVSLGSTSTASSDSPTPTQQSQTVKLAETPTPTATPNPNAGAGAYVSVVTLDSTTMSDDLNAVGDVCGSGQDLNGCRAALVTARDDSQSFLDDLDAHPVPPCLTSVDKPLRAALHDIHAAAQEVIDGIDTYSVSKVQNGTALMNKATTEINTASSELDKVSCS